MTSRIENAILRVPEITEIQNLSEVSTGMSSTYSAKVTYNGDTQTIYLKMNAYDSISPRQFTSEIDVLRFLEDKDIPVPTVIGNGLLYDKPYFITFGMNGLSSEVDDYNQLGEEIGRYIDKISSIDVPQPRNSQFGRVLEINDNNIYLQNDSPSWDDYIRRYANKRYDFIRSRDSKYFNISTVEDIVDEIERKSRDIDRNPRSSLIHNDLREDNIIWDKEIKSILDWERTLIGHDIYFLISTRELFSKQLDDSNEFVDGLYDGWDGSKPTSTEDRLYSLLKYLDEISGFPAWWGESERKERKEKIINQIS
jgi:fructosamine-3-kinase